MKPPIGTIYGSWTVIGEGTASDKVLCQCACGRVSHEIRVHDLVQSKSKMCRKCSVSVTKTTHGVNKHKAEYSTWVHMIQRCTNSANKDFSNYGGRGIIVCDLWLNSFEAFYLAMGPKPGPKYTIERLDYNRGYENGNCVWATRTQQNRNTRSNVNLTIDGTTQTVSMWAEHPDCSVTAFTIYKRLERNWEPREAVFTPSKGKK